MQCLPTKMHIIYSKTILSNSISVIFLLLKSIYAKHFLTTTLHTSCLYHTTRPNQRTTKTSLQHFYHPLYLTPTKTSSAPSVNSNSLSFPSKPKSLPKSNLVILFTTLFLATVFTLIFRLSFPCVVSTV